MKNGKTIWGSNMTRNNKVFSYHSKGKSKVKSYIKNLLVFLSITFFTYFALMFLDKIT